MGKNIKNGFDEVEIIQRRDGAVDAKFVGPLNARGRRALADARLLALALTLPAGQDAGKAGRGADDPDETELLAYLLDDLSDARRNELERSIRGNARSIGRLMKLRTALNPVADKRGLHRPELAARNILRRTGQALEVREVGKKLEFRERRPQLRPGPTTGGMLNDLLDRASAPILGGDLGKEARHLLARWEVLTRTAKQPQAYDGVDSELQQLGRRCCSSWRRCPITWPAQSGALSLTPSMQFRPGISQFGRLPRLALPSFLPSSQVFPNQLRMAFLFGQTQRRSKPAPGRYCLKGAPCCLRSSR
jgi:hypothetical protein